MQAPIDLKTVDSHAPLQGPVPGNFVDISAKSHVSFNGHASHTSMKYLLETMGSGVALFDYDNDNRLDIFLVNGAPLGDPTLKGTIPQKTDPKYWNRLFHQKRWNLRRRYREGRASGKRLWHGSRCGGL